MRVKLSSNVCIPAVLTEVNMIAMYNIHPLSAEEALYVITGQLYRNVHCYFGHSKKAILCSAELTHSPFQCVSSAHIAFSLKG